MSGSPEQAAGPKVSERRVGLSRLAVGLAAALVAVSFLVPKLSSIKGETDRFERIGLRDSGRIPRPLPERMVVAAQGELRAGETWAFNTRVGICPVSEHFYWLSFRLMPNVADCADPDLEIYAGVPPPTTANVVRRGANFWLVRP